MSASSRSISGASNPVKETSIPSAGKRSVSSLSSIDKQVAIPATFVTQCVVSKSVGA